MTIKLEAAQRLIARSGEVEVYVYNKMGRLISSDKYNPESLKSIFKGDASPLMKGKIVRSQQGNNVYYRCMQQVADKATQRLNVNNPNIVDSVD